MYHSYNTRSKKRNNTSAELPQVKEDIVEEVLSFDEPDKKFDLTFNNLYGALLYQDNIAIFVNRTQNYFIFNEKKEIINNGERRLELTQYDIVYKDNIKDILNIFKERIEYIYYFDKKDFIINLNMDVSNRRMIRKGGNDFIIKIPINDKIIPFQLHEHNYQKLFKLPDETYNFDYFIDQFAKCDRGYMTTTRDIKYVNAVFLCFFHINEFQITTRFRQYSDITEIINDKNLKIPDDNHDKYKIIQKCRNLTCKSSVLCEKPHFCVQQCQDYVYSSQIINTASEIYNIINNGGEKLYPVHVDAEADVVNDERSFHIADGNHRIYTLKRLGYNGYVPCICCDYLPVESLK
jgi:hypothetical protein